MCRVERRTYGSAPDPECVRYLLVLKIRVVAKEHDEPLSLREMCDCRAYLREFAGMPVRIGRSPLRQEAVP